jgi:hypothetical protein
MGKWLKAILVLPALLLLAGCGRVDMPPQTKQPTVAEPRMQPAAADAGAAQGQLPPRAGTSEPDETRPPITPAGENTGTGVEIGGPATGKASSETPAHDTPDSARSGAERLEVKPPAPVTTPEAAGTNSAKPDRAETVGPDKVASQPTEPNKAETAGPDKVASRPAEPNEAARPAEPASGLTRFYEEYATILQTYVREDGWVDYATLNRHRLDLKSLLSQIDELDPNVYRAWPRQEELAFWVNAYNLKMLEVIERNYPIQSSRWLRLTWPPSDIRHIRGIWTDYKFIVMDEEFTLAAVEQQFFDKTFGDPRVYLAIMYATRSGPPLRREPYRGNGLNRQLDEQVRRFLSSPRGLQIDRRNMVVHLSAIFKPSWHGKEFVARYGTDRKFKDRDPATRAVLSFLTNYLSREDVDFLEVENYTLAYMNFDWRLNDGSEN